MGPKMRRTSLPAISIQRSLMPTPQPPPVANLSTATAIISEAHGIVTDMLVDKAAGALPPHILAGLHSLANLLEPPIQGGHRHTPHQQQALPSLFSMLRMDDTLSSSSEELPFIGETAGELMRRRSIHPSMLRRMSCSTWSTTTSATGMPTIEAEPSNRRRHTVFQNALDVSPCTSPTQSSTNLTVVGQEPTGVPYNKPRSFSVSSLQPFLARARQRERKLTLGTPASPGGVSSSLAVPRDDDGRVASEEDVILELEEPDAELTVPTSITTALSRSPSPNGGGSAAPAAPPLPPVTVSFSPRRLSVLEEEVSAANLCSHCLKQGGDEVSKLPLPCPLCRSQGQLDFICPVHRRPSEPYTRVCGTILQQGERRHSANLECTIRHGDVRRGSVACRCRLVARDCRILLSPTRCCDVTSGDLAFIKESLCEEDEEHSKISDEVPTDDKTILMKDGSRYHTDHLQNDELLASAYMWDYPIFDLEKQAGNQMLSQMCYRVFHDTGLLETFRIPLQEFFNYFHALELGYRDKPYHNRMHATDVLQAVYYLTSQPIPGFQMMTDDSPPTSTSGGDICQQRQTFVAEDTYGIMGANLPALELMALYTAAAMHDYDHPGRTNAFLVTTLAPQAVLYNDRAVLENHHAASAWSLFFSHPEHNFLCHLEKSEFRRFRFLVIEAILATDLKRHFEILAEFSSKTGPGGGIDWKSEADRLLVMEMAIKLADINGPCKDFPLHYQWTLRIAEEFYEQGLEEEALGLTVSPYMDRKNPQLAKLQESFINHLVGPMCNCYFDCGLMPGIWVEKEEMSDVSSCSSEGQESDEKTEGKTSPAKNVFCIQNEHLIHNHARWTEIIKEEQGNCEISISVSAARSSSPSVSVVSDQDNHEESTVGSAALDPSEECRTTSDERRASTESQNLSCDQESKL